MRLMFTILFSGVVAFGAAGAMAEDTTVLPPGQVQAGLQSDHREGPPGGPRGVRFGSRSPPSDGGAVGTVDSVSPSSFEISVSPAHKVTVETASFTTYRKGKSSTSASAITTGERVLVLGIVSFDAKEGLRVMSITARYVIVQPANGPASATSAAGEYTFQRGAPSAAKRVGEIPADYVEGEGTIVNGTVAYKAIEAALASSFPHGIINRVVKVSNGAYECHNITVNWPHHIFVTRNFKVVGAF
ncbi:MAG: hypothetical protein QOK23_2385 [Gammaproteobacteria bacterium]|jgi:hypothetical protein|nr:hypothetical protein [Gammaproteobacteria bacterium]